MITYDGGSENENESGSDEDSVSNEFLRTNNAKRKSHCKDIPRLGREQRPQNTYKLLYAYERERNKSLTEQLRDKQDIVKAKEKELKEKNEKLQLELECWLSEMSHLCPMITPPCFSR